MARYFMGDTRLAGLERMMMDPSRSPSTHTLEYAVYGGARDTELATTR